MLPGKKETKTKQKTFMVASDELCWWKKRQLRKTGKRGVFRWGLISMQIKCLIMTSELFLGGYWIRLSVCRSVLPH